MTTTTTDSTYDADLERATALGWRAIVAEFPENEEGDDLLEQMSGHWGDALNNAWIEGLTIEEWVATALKRIGRVSANLGDPR